MRFTVLLAVVTLAALASVACGVPSAPRSNSTEPSEWLRSVLRQDREFYRQKLLQANSSTLSSISTSSVYTESVAQKMFWHSVTAYCTDDANLYDWDCNSCHEFGQFTVTGIMDDTTNQGYVGWFRGLPASPIANGGGPKVPASAPFVVVAFRGTVPSDISDWIEDLSASTFAAFDSRYPNVQVHSGFWGAYQDMKPGMMQGLKQAISDSGATTILYAGHSLGAAMAELAAIDLKINDYPNMLHGSYTAGTPRVGNQAFADLFAQQIDVSFRLIHNRDIVPHLPPLIMGFRHGLEEIFYTEDFSSYQKCTGTPYGEDPACSDQFDLPISISDHTHYFNVEVGTYCSDAKVAARKALEKKQAIAAASEIKARRPRIVLTEN
jgi:hypothetical protein